MEFYKITKNETGYALVEEGQGEGAQITQEQLGFMMDHLSALYQKQETLPLGIRAYAMAYYSNDQTSYISLKASPSEMKDENSLLFRFGSGVILDGFATTFLDGELENRVWIGQDGAVENRGPSTEAVKVLLVCLVEALNQGINGETMVCE